MITPAIDFRTYPTRKSTSQEEPTSSAPSTGMTSTTLKSTDAAYSPPVAKIASLKPYPSPIP